MVRFGPFTIDTRTWTLSRDGDPVDLSPRLVEILAHLVRRDGAIVTKDELLDRFWPDVHVTENTLTRAVADIRKALGDSAERPQVIQTLARRGYRFVGTKEEDGSVPRVATAPIGGEPSDPFRLWVSGRLALESLDPARLDEARHAMESAVAAMPDYAPAHAGAANARLVAFERTRTANRPDVARLEAAIASAQQAVALDPRLGEGWAVLGHAHALAGRLDDAQASLRRAIAIEPDSWRHHVRLALATWGEARLRAADRALALWPSCAVAHLLSGMVFIARGAWDRAEAAASAGAQLQDTQLPHAILPVAGLHWLRGLALTGQDRCEAAAGAMRHEVFRVVSGLYAIESRWLALSSLGFLHLDGGRPADARAAFVEADACNPGAGRSRLGLYLSGAAGRAELDAALAQLREGPKAAEALLLDLATLAWSGDIETAIARLHTCLRDAPAGPHGWNLAADPMFLPVHRHARFGDLVAAIAARAA